MIRTRAAIALVAVLLCGPLLACSGGDDDGGSTTTTEDDADDPAAAGGGTGGDGSDPEDDGSASTLPPGVADDTAPRDPDSPLRDLLADPTEVGEAYAEDPGLGDGSFETDLCDAVSIEATWEESGSQALSAATGDGTVIYAESILTFTDAVAAATFIDAAVDGYLTCLPEMERTDPDIGDGAVVLRNDDLISTQVYAFVRVGPRVAALRASTDPGGDLPVDDDLLAGAATRMAG